MTSNPGKNRMVELLEPMATGEGLTDSIIENVKFFRSNGNIKKGPFIFEPGALIIAQGQKIGYLGDEIYRFDPDNYLVVAAPLPMECETIATPEKPLLGVAINLEPVMISELLIEMDSISSASKSIPKSIPRVLYSSRLTEVLRNTVVRLLEYLSHPVDGRMLGPQAAREIIYRILTGEHGDVLRLLAMRHGRFGEMAKVLLRIHTDFSSKLDIQTLAAEAGMSVSSFHSNFKAVTNTSPIQYIKKLRLQKARILMVRDDCNAINAAAEVGYESASQFNREFKRYFGNTPVDEAERMRSMA